jgi:hypothetical protein
MVPQIRVWGERTSNGERIDLEVNGLVGKERKKVITLPCQSVKGKGKGKGKVVPVLN